MPEKSSKPIYSDEERRVLVSQLNLFYPESFPWETVNARKSHVDLFGSHIEDGDIYYRRSVGVAFGNVIKLSEKSMDRLLRSISYDNHQFEHLAKRLQEIKTKSDREAIEEARPVGRARTKHLRPSK